jgi:hypothetical protein
MGHSSRWNKVPGLSHPSGLGCGRRLCLKTLHLFSPARGLTLCLLDRKLEVFSAYLLIVIVADVGAV